MSTPVSPPVKAPQWFLDWLKKTGAVTGSVGSVAGQATKSGTSKILGALGIPNPAQLLWILAGVGIVGIGVALMVGKAKTEALTEAIKAAPEIGAVAA